MTQKEIDELIERHGHYLRRDCKGWRYMSLYLNGEDLSWLDLSGKNLSYATLINVDFSDAKLINANLSGSFLYSSNFLSADLTNADLFNASVAFSTFVGANLSGVNLETTKIYGATFADAINCPKIPFSCPETGSFIGYKRSKEGYIIKLLIPDDAKRLSGTTEVCRCDKAKVLAIQTVDKKKVGVKTVHSRYDPNFCYTLGDTVQPSSFDENRWHEFSSGIYFFVNRKDAVNYY